MAIWFAPEPGMVLMCDFAGYTKPEIVKTRRVVVISRKRYHANLADATAIVVPLSETAPRSVRPWHYRIAGDSYAGLGACWAKGDMIAHVSMRRLDRILCDRKRMVPVLNKGDLAAIRAAAGNAIGLHLT